MYNNETGGPAFHEFLETIGQKINLKGFDKYKAGLDIKCNLLQFCVNFNVVIMGLLQLTLLDFNLSTPSIKIVK